MQYQVEVGCEQVFERMTRGVSILKRRRYTGCVCEKESGSKEKGEEEERYCDEEKEDDEQTMSLWRQLLFDWHSKFW